MRFQLQPEVVGGGTAALVAAVVVTVLSPLTWTVLAIDGLLVVILLAAAYGWGWWPTRWLLDDAFGGAARFTTAVALGLGLVGLLTLGLGLAGLLTQVAGGLLVVAGLGLAASSRLKSKSRKQKPPRTATARPMQIGAWLAMIPLGVMLGLAVVGGSLPVGILWPAEARGYDVLEYHLQAPREYFEAGAIDYLPHNVYAQFPQQVESLYLLLMQLVGDARSAMFASQFLHVALGVLTVIAVGGFLRPGWGRLAAVLVVGGTGWIAYLGPLAYVENGLLLFAAGAGGIVLKDLEAPAADAVPAGCRRLLAGILAGFAGGCKYTALGLVAVPLGVVWAAAMRGSPGQRLATVALVGIGSAASFGPWAARNAVWTGNPVYPLASGLFPTADWTAEQAAQWSTGHALPEDADGLRNRLARFWQETIASGLMGPGVIGLGAFGAVLALRGGLRRPASALAVWAVGIVAVWAAATYMPGRFLVPLMLPLGWLAGLGSSALQDALEGRHKGLSVFLVAAAFASAIYGAVEIGRRYGREMAYWARLEAPLASLVGQSELFAQPETNFVHASTPPDARVWLVGKADVLYIDRLMHYTVVFSRDPWIDFCETGVAPAAAVDWLRSRNFSHVVFSWAEIGRLRRTYGFSPIVTREWVAQLEAAGLEPVAAQRGPRQQPVVETYRVPE